MMIMFSSSAHADQYLRFFDLYDGTTISTGNPLIFNIAGYGDVSFSAGFNEVTGTDSVFEIGPVNGNYYLGSHPYIIFDNGDTLLIDFLGITTTGPAEVGFSTPAVASFSSELQIGSGTPYDSTITFRNVVDSRNGGVSYFAFETAAVPEPSGALLILSTGILAIVRRRRLPQA